MLLANLLQRFGECRKKHDQILGRTVLAWVGLEVEKGRGYTHARRVRRCAIAGNEESFGTTIVVSCGAVVDWLERILLV